MEDNDATLQLKKRSRRRLVGAVAFAGLAAVVLPMVMDHQPPEETADVDIRIPGQDDKPFTPRFAVVPPPVEAGPAEKPAAKPAEKIAEKPAAPPTDKLAEKPVVRPAESAPPKPEKAAEKIAEKSPPKSAVTPASKPNSADAQRAAAILAGKVPDVATGGQYVILIGAFANPANVRNLQAKLTELGIKVYTEPLESPEGKKTRVRAGPFPSREAGEKALERMKRIGVGGVLAARQ